MADTERTPFHDAELYEVLFHDLEFDRDFYVGLAREAGGPVLEVACGTGRVLLPCLQAGVDIDGLDLFPEMLDVLRHKAAERGLSPRLYQTDMRDFTLPRRFNLKYIGEDGNAHQPLMVHRALYGSMERFFGILVEHYAGAFPVWLAPIQAIVLPITDRQAEYAKQVQEQLKAAGIRVTLDDRKEKVNLKIREAQLQKIPYMLVVGDREAENGTVSVRNRKHADQGVKPVADFLVEIQKLIDSKAPSE